MARTKKNTKPATKAKTSKAKAKPRAGARLQPAHTAQLELSIPIDAPRERVFQALLNETTAWWPADFFAAGMGRACPGPAPVMRIEPRVGGRMYEDWGEGRGALWATVLTIDPPARLEMIGHVTPTFGGPLSNTLQFLLEPRGTSACTLKLVDSMVGAVKPGTAESMDEGWKMLLGQALRAHCEG